MELNWYIVNEKIFAMEARRKHAKADPVEWEKFKKEWDGLVDLARKYGGVKRDKYEENNQQTDSQKRTKKGRKGDNV